MPALLGQWHSMTGSADTTIALLHCPSLQSLRLSLSLGSSLIHFCYFAYRPLIRFFLFIAILCPLIAMDIQDRAMATVLSLIYLPLELTFRNGLSINTSNLLTLTMGLSSALAMAQLWLSSANIAAITQYPQSFF